MLSLNFDVNRIDRTGSWIDAWVDMYFTRVVELELLSDAWFKWYVD